MPTSNNPIKFIPCSKSAYDNLQVKDEDTLYFITDKYRIYVGSNEYTKSLVMLQDAPTSSTVGVDGKLYYYAKNSSLYTVHKVNANSYSWSQVSNFVDISNLEVAQTSIPEVRTTEYQSTYIPDLTDPIFTHLAIGQYFWFERSETPHFCVKIASDDWKYAWWTVDYISSLNIPTATSELTNDSGFLTSHQDISGKEDKSNKVVTVGNSSSTTEYPSVNAMSKYVIYAIRDKADKATTLAGYGITDAYTKNQVDGLIPTVPSNVSAFTNDAGYLTQHQDVSGKEDTSNKVTSISGSITNTQYPSALAVKTYVDTVIGGIENGSY